MENLFRMRAGMAVNPKDQTTMTTMEKSIAQLFEIELFEVTFVNIENGDRKEVATYLLPDEAHAEMSPLLEPYSVSVQFIFDSIGAGHLAMGDAFAWLIVALDGCYDIADEIVAARECKSDINFTTYGDWRGPVARGLLPPVSVFCIRSREVLEAAAGKCRFLDGIRQLVGDANEYLHWLLVYRPEAGTPVWPEEEPDFSTR